ncbi:hypothetical protein [Brevibacillus formosus]
MEIAQVNTGICQKEEHESQAESMSTETFAQIYGAYYKRVYKYILIRLR